MVSVRLARAAHVVHAHVRVGARLAAIEARLAAIEKTLTEIP